jgi:transposase
MADRTDAKTEALRARGSLNPHPEQVVDERFAPEGFFDPRDLVQAKYEMLRRVRVEGDAVARAAKAFGFSRPTFYAARAALQGRGLPGLVPGKPGPRGARKLTEEVVDVLEGALAQDPSLRPGDLAALVAERFGTPVHPRSVERALRRRQEKKRR